MPTKTWKGRERKTAKDFGSERTPLSGGNSKHTRSDSLHPQLFIEHKHRQSHTAVNLYDETAKLAKKENKITVIALSQHSRHGYLILIDPKDLDVIAELYKGCENKT